MMGNYGEECAALDAKPLPQSHKALRSPGGRMKQGARREKEVVGERATKRRRDERTLLREEEEEEETYSVGFVQI